MRLESLVQAIQDPCLLNYVVLYMERQLPGLGRHTVAKLRHPGRERTPAESTYLQARLELQLRLRLELEMAGRLSSLRRLDRLVRELSHEPDPDLRDRLADNNPEVRWAAIRVVSGRRRPLGPELVGLLDDHAPEVRQAAWLALVRLGRGTDFGPRPDASRPERRRAMQRWRTWLALQQTAGEAPHFIPDPAAIAALLGTPPAHPPAKDPGAEDPRAAPRAGLLRATGPQREAGLARLRDAEGTQAAEALARAVPELTGPAPDQAHEALAERLARLLPQALRDKFKDEDAEVRRAAARACVRLAAKECIPELLELLDDPERPVVQAARQALKDLTGEDFGPRPEDSFAGRTLARAAWNGWWLQEQKKR